MKDSDPVFKDFKGLASFANPYAFDGYIGDVVALLETHFSCIIEPVVSSRAAYEAFLKGIYAIEVKDHTLWLWLNVITDAVRHNMRFAVVRLPGSKHHPPRYLMNLEDFGSHVVAVCLGLAAMRAELNVPMYLCQISLRTVMDLAERLGFDESLLLFDQDDLLGPCVDFALTD